MESFDRIRFVVMCLPRRHGQLGLKGVLKIHLVSSF